MMKIPFPTFVRVCLIICTAGVGFGEVKHAAGAPVAATRSAADTPTVTNVTEEGKADAIDPEGMALLKKSEDAMLALKTYRAERWTTTSYDPSPNPWPPSYKWETIVAEKPNRMHYELFYMDKDSDGTWKRHNPNAKKPDDTFISDGKTYKMDVDSNYSENDAAGREARFELDFLLPWPGFFAASDSPYKLVTAAQHDKQLLEVRHMGRKSVEGVLCERVFVRLLARPYNPGLTEYYFTWYIGPDGVVRRQTKEWPDEHTPPVTEDAIIRNIQVNQPIDDSANVFTFPPLPAGREFARETKAN